MTLDPIDAQLEIAGVAAGGQATRTTFDDWLMAGWSPGAIPAMLVLLAGMALGPQGLAVLTPSVLAFLEPVGSIAMAAVGVMCALELRSLLPGVWRIGVAASLQASVTALVVTGGIVAIANQLPGFATSSPLVVAVIAGVCAATSSSLPLRPATDNVAAHVSTADGLLPIVLGGLVLAVLRETSLDGALWLVAQWMLVTLAIAAAGWLLLSRASTETEQRVFAVAVLLLLGGASDYLSVSALFSGLAAGVFWQLAGGTASENMRRDIGHVQHTLLVLVLLLAGARAALSFIALSLGAAYVVLRLAGKLAGGLFVQRLLTTDGAELRVRLVNPGILGVAFALNAIRAVGTELTPLLTATVVGTIASSLLAAAAQDPEHES